MAKKTTSSKTQTMRAARETKSAAARRTVAEATPPNALDVALDLDDAGDEDEKPSTGHVTTPAPVARPVGRLVGLPKPVHNPSDYAVDDDAEDDDDDSDTDLDAGDDDDGAEKTPAAKGGKAVNAQFWAEAEKLGPAHAKATTTKKARTRVQRLLKALSRWDIAEQTSMLKAVDALESAEAHLAVAVNALESVPRDWRPMKTRKAQGEALKLAPGTIVAVREKQRAGYEELVDEAAYLDALTVERHAKNKVVVRAKDGSKLFFPRGHLIVTTPAAAS